MHTVLRRSFASLRPAPLSICRSLSLSTVTSSETSGSSLGERLQQRRKEAAHNGSEARAARAVPDDASLPSQVDSPSQPARQAVGNLPAEFGRLTDRAIRADPVASASSRKEKSRERLRVERWKRDRHERSKRRIDAKLREAGEGQEAEKNTEGTSTETAVPLAQAARRRIGFANPGREHRDRKKSLRLARLASGGELTTGEKEKLATFQKELKLLKQKRRRMVPWDRLSIKTKKMEFYKIERRQKREEERKKANGREDDNVERLETNPPMNPHTLTAPEPPSPSASFDEIVSVVTPPLSVPHDASQGGRTAAVPESSDPLRKVEAPLSKGAESRLDKALRAQAAAKAWSMRRTTIDIDIKALEATIASYQPPPEVTESGTKGPDVPGPRERTEPPLMEQFADRLSLSSSTGSGGAEGGSEWAARLLMEAVDDANATTIDAKGETKSLPPHMSSASPPAERGRKHRHARHSSFRSESVSQDPPSTGHSQPPRELSSYDNIVSPESVPFAPTPSPFPPVPIAKLAHSLSRTLFNPGVHFLRDPRSGVYNFSPEILENVPKLGEFEFDKLPRYVTSSKDEVLKQVAKREGKLFSGSTSSTVGLLCQVYFWMSKGKEVNTSMLSAPWSEKDRSFSMGQQLPVSVILNYDAQEGTYSIDADKSFDATSESNVLSQYGHLMEKLLTTEPKEFKRFLAGSDDPAPSEADHRQAYHYATTDDMVLRSQLDAVHEYLPGNGTFDLKTRGTVAIRQDRLNYEESAGYKIDRLRGPWESFEREYYDLIRSAFLKYQFQARIGCMDGIFVAYHSTARFYGFQYLPISEMDEALFDTHESGRQVFKLAVGTLEKLLREATRCYSGETVRVTVAADTFRDVLRLFVSPVRPQEGTDGERGGEVEQREPMTLLEVRGANFLDGEYVAGPVVVRPREDGAVPVWQIGYEIKRSDNSTLEAPRSRISTLFGQVRETQRMFSSLMLPTGVTAKDVKEAAQRAQQSGVELDRSDLSIRFPVIEGVTYRGPSFQARDLRKMSRQGTERTRLEEKEREGDQVVVVRSSFDVLT